MRYSVEVTPNFKREAKRLIKKYPSLKDELAILFSELEKNPVTVHRWGMIFTKSELPLHQKGKVNQAEPGLYRMLK